MNLSRNPQAKGQACEMLVQKAALLGRLPQKADFSVEDLVFIKAHLGPWPRALEAAGLKEKPKFSHPNGNQNRLKRKRRAQKAGPDAVKAAGPDCPETGVDGPEG